MIITAIPEPALPQIWPQVAPLIHRALKRDEVERMTLADIYQLCASGRMNLWVVAEEDTKQIIAAFMFQIVIYPQYRALLIRLAGGEKMEEWATEGFEVVRRYAADIGCRTIEVTGREGWEKFLPKMTGMKWNKISVTMEHDLQSAEAVAVE